MYAEITIFCDPSEVARCFDLLNAEQPARYETREIAAEQRRLFVWAETALRDVGLCPENPAQGRSHELGAVESLCFDLRVFNGRMVDRDSDGNPIVGFDCDRHGLRSIAENLGDVRYARYPFVFYSARNLCLFVTDDGEMLTGEALAEYLDEV